MKIGDGDGRFFIINAHKLFICIEKIFSISGYNDKSWKFKITQNPILSLVLKIYGDVEEIVSY